MFDKYMGGQPIAVSILKKAINENKISHAYLIDTNNYEGSYDLVMTFVKSILCPNNHLTLDDSKKCDICKRIDDGNYMELKIIEPDGTWIKKEQLQNLQDDFSKKGIEGSKRIYIIKESDKMNTQAANSILKFLEEPSDNIIAILMTNNVSKLLDTIVSRCQLIRLHGNDKEKMTTIEKFANLVTSNTSDIDNFLQDEKNVEFIRNVMNFIKEYENRKVSTIVNIKKIWHNYFNNKSSVDMAVDLLINFYYDVLLTLVGKSVLFYDDYVDDVKYVSGFNTVSTTLHKLEVLMAAKNDLKYNLNLNLFIDKLIIDMEGDK